MVKISLFGYPQVDCDGRPLHLSRRKSAALLAYLAVTARPESRDALATLFWPDYDPSTSRASLRRILSELNQELCAQLLEADRTQVSFRPDAAAWVDVVEFRRLVDQARRHAHPQNAVCPDCLRDLSEAADLYQGDFLSGFSLPDSPDFDEWQFFEADSLRQALAETLQRLAEWHRLESRYDQAVRYARRWLALDPLHEPAQRQLIELFALTGQQAAALRQYEEFRRQLKAEIGTAPEPETTALYEAVRRRQVVPPGQQPSAPHTPTGLSPGPPARPAHNLPAQTTPFVGREELLEELSAFLRGDSPRRLVTLIGPGGSGKTRLAVEAAQRLADLDDGRPPDGVWFVPLAAVDQPDAILSAVASSLQLSFSTGRDQHRQQLLNYLQGKKLVLLLDNFEHLISPEAVSLVGEILAGAGKVKILATSRTRLGLRGENLLPVPGLEVKGQDSDAPAGAEEALPGAGRLFCQSARQVNPGFELTPENLPVVTQICELVEGMPLAIELAASWAGLLSLEEICNEIRASLDFLETGLQDVPERQRSMRAVFDSSWKLLDEKERGLLQAAAVFPGSFSREAVEAVAGAAPKDLLGLVEKFWLRRDSAGRYALHELSRQYAAEKLAADPPALQWAAERHAGYYASLLAQQAEIMRGSRQKEAFQTIAGEYHNARAAWDWYLQTGQVAAAVRQILPAFFLFSETRTRSYDLLPMVSSALRQVEGMQAAQERDLLLAVLLTIRGAFYLNSLPIRYETFGLFLPADQQAVETAWETASRRDLFLQMGFWGILLVYIYGRTVDVSAAIGRLRVLAGAFAEQGLEWEQACALSFLGMLLEVVIYKEGQPALVEEIHAVLGRALAIFEQLGDWLSAAAARRSIGQLLAYEGDYAGAIERWQIALRFAEDSGDWLIATGTSWQIGNALIRSGDFERAFAVFRELRRKSLERGDTWQASFIISKESLEMSRFGSLEEARRLREMSLSLAVEAGDHNGQMWNYWELGEIARQAGDHPRARENYETVRQRAVQLRDQAALIFYQRGLGDLAQSEGRFVEALESFQDSLSLAEAQEHRWAAAYAWSGIGRAELCLNRGEQAFASFKRALRISQEVSDTGLALIALAGLAAYHAEAGEVQPAAELAGLVLSRRDAWRETRAWAASLLQALEEKDPERSRAAAEQGGRLRLDEVLASMLSNNAESPG